MTRRVVSSLALVAARVCRARRCLARPRRAAPPQQATFRARVDSVTVDVEVTDKTGKPVDDLTADDFEIKEGKTVQTVDTFKLIKIDDDPNAGDRRARSSRSRPWRARPPATTPG